MQRARTQVILDRARDAERASVDEFVTVNASLDYRFASGFAEGSRLRLGVNNLFDEDPPVADEQMGYFGSLHSNRGRYVYLDYVFNF